MQFEVGIARRGSEKITIRCNKKPRKSRGFLLLTFRLQPDKRASRSPLLVSSLGFSGARLGTPAGDQAVAVRSDHAEHMATQLIQGPELPSAAVVQV